MADFDVLVIGAGPGGYPAAIRAAQLGLKTACVEKEKLGGVCLNWGCIPSKALLESAKLARTLRDAAAYGLKVDGFSVDYPAVVERSRKVAKRFERGVAGLFKKYGVSPLEGTAKIVGPGRVVLTSSSGEREITATHVVIATGARPKAPPSIPVDGERVHTYRTAIVSSERPESAVVLGAGAIGVEFAWFWSSLGVPVTLIEALDEVLPLEDREVGAELRKQLVKQGLTVRTGVRVDRVERRGDACAVTLAGGEELSAHTVLVALGVAPNTEGLGLDAVGIRTDERGRIPVDRSHRTRAAGFYAVGDVCDGGPALAHVAMRQAHVCVERIAGHTTPDVDYTAVPSCTYCQPQVASVGMTEEAARAAGRAYEVGRFPFTANGRAQGAGHPEGFVKVLIDPEYGELLGAHVIGADATEQIAELVLARGGELTADVIAATMHAHPTASEAVFEAVATALGEGVHL